MWINSQLTAIMFTLLTLCVGCTSPPASDPEAVGDRVVDDTDQDSDSSNPDDTSGVEPGTDDCTPEGQPLVGEARLVCSAGSLEPSGACTASEEPTVWDTLSCDSYVSAGEQRLEQAGPACATATSAECCSCSFEVDATCNPCEVSD